jgi:hypothetical protein
MNKTNKIISLGVFEMRIRYFLAILIALSILVSSCDEINKLINPSSDEYLIDKTISASSTEQIVESGTEFKMIFPANAISGNLEVKVKKESSATDIGNSNLKAPNSFFKINLSGDANFQKPVQFIINFDKSSIPSGKTAQESVFGYIYSSGTWKLANYQLDEVNSKIIISISGINGNINKDEPILLDDGEIIIGGFTTVDLGQSDNPLSKYNFFSMLIVSNVLFDDGDLDEDTQFEYNYQPNSPAIKWNGNDFSFKRIKIEPKDWIKDYDALPDSTIEIGYGKVAKDGKKLIEFNIDYNFVSRTYYGSSEKPDLKVIKKTVKISNLNIYLPDPKLFPNGYPYEEITGAEISKYISNLNYHYYYYHWDSIDKEDDITEKKTTTYNWNGAYSRLQVYFLKLDNVK